MDSDLDNARLQAALKRIEETEYTEEERSYMDIMLDQIAEHAAVYGWHWSRAKNGDIVLQRGKYTIQFGLDALDDTFGGGTVTTDLRHDTELFSAMKQLGAAQTPSNE